jgi:hypothetical protein
VWREEMLKLAAMIARCGQAYELGGMVAPDLKVGLGKRHAPGRPLTKAPDNLERIKRGPATNMALCGCSMFLPLRPADLMRPTGHPRRRLLDRDP